MVGAGAEAGADDVEGEEDGGQAEGGNEAAGDGWVGVLARGSEDSRLLVWARFLLVFLRWDGVNKGHDLRKI